MNALKIRIRTKKSDSAYVYHTLEAHEGLTAYRTLPHREGEQEREMELIFTMYAERDVLDLLADLQKKMELVIVDSEGSIS